MKARIKKDVRPYGGRVFEVLEQGTYNNGRAWVELGAPSPRTAFGLFGKTVSPRRYGLDEVDILQNSTHRKIK